MTALLLAGVLVVTAPAVPELPLGPVRVKARHLEVTHGRIVEADQGVDFAAPGIKAHAERVRFDAVTGLADIDGGVSLELLSQGDTATLSAESASIDLKQQTGTLRRARFEGLGIHMAGEAISRRADGSWRIEHARFSPCACEGTPSWQIKASSITATRTGIAILKNGVLEAKGVPIFYLPIGFAPYSSDRATGFLAPTISQGGNDGLVITVPFYVGFSRRWDATLSPGWDQLRGPFLLDSLRFATAHGAGEVELDYHQDTQVASEAVPNGPAYSPDRWFTSVRWTEEAAPGDLLKARIDNSGDDRYSYDFGPSQMERSQSEYEDDLFGEHHGSVLGLVAGSTYYQDLRIIGSAGPYNSAQTVSRLGFLQGETSGVDLLGESGHAISLDLPGQYDFFDNIASPQGGFRRGGELAGTPRRQVQHTRVAPSLVTPVSLLDDAVRLDTFAGGIGDASADPLGTDSRARLAPLVGGDADMEWRRTFEVGDTRVQHRIGPFVNYSYIPSVWTVGGDLTSFEGPADVPLQGNNVELGISNRIFYRRLDGEDTPAPVRELIEVFLSELYQPAGPRDGDTVGRMALRTGPVRVDLDVALDNDARQVATAGGRAATAASAPAGVSIDYAYAPERQSHQATGGGWIRLAELAGSRDSAFTRALRSLTVEAGTRYDAIGHQVLSVTGAATYESPCGCFGLKLSAAQEADRQRYSVLGVGVPLTSINLGVELHPPRSFQRFTTASGGS